MIQERRSLTPWALEIARATAQRSRDPNTKVGAIILRPDKSIASVGYNGFPRAMEDREEWYSDREEKLLRVVHAEVNALIQARMDVTGCTIYITNPPCRECAKYLIAAGIVRVIWDRPSPEFAERWAEDMKIAKRLFKDSNVEWWEHSLGAASATESGTSAQAA